MASNNKNSNNLVSEQDDDPTAELEILSAAPCIADAIDHEVERESEANTFDFDKLQSEVGDGTETVGKLKSDLKSRAESIRKLQFDIELLRSKWSGLEKELKVREEISANLTAELNATNKKRLKADKLLKKRDEEIASLRSKLTDQEQSLQDSAERIEQSDEREKATDKKLARSDKLLKVRDKKIASLRSKLTDQKQSLQDSARLIEQSEEREKTLESAAAEMQLRIQETEERLSELTAESQQQRTNKREATEQLRSLSDEVDSLNRDLATSNATIAELQSHIKSGKTDWNRQETQLLTSRNRLKALEAELREDRSIHDDLSSRLKSLEAERDELVNEAARLRKDVQDVHAQRTEAEKNLRESQKGVLSGKDFEISALKSQVSRTESYADELRLKLQDQLLLKDELQTRIEQLKKSLASSDLQAQELSEGIEKLRASNSVLLEEKSRLSREFEEEVRQIRFELGEAQETIADREEINQQLTSDLVDTREFKMNLENQLSDSKEKSGAALAGLERKLARLEAQVEEQTDKLTTKDNAIAALFNELSKKSEAIESIVQIEGAIHDLDNRMSEQIDDIGGAERERITRLLIGKIDGQELRFPLFKNRLTIGRTGHNDIQLKAPFISRRHAVIVSDEGKTRIVDWGSKNGVFVNARKIKEKVLRNGDIVTIGTADFKFEERPKR